MLTFIAVVCAAIAFVIIANFRLYLLKQDILDEIKELLPVRAKDKKGRFVADDPNTPENEAWEAKPRKTRRK